MAVISADTKDALARELPSEAHCRQALLAGLAFYGSSGGQFVTHRNAVARLFWSLLDERKSHPIETRAPTRLQRLPTFAIALPERLTVPPPKPAHRCDRLIEVRAAFLACGSLAAGARGYHLEFVARSDEIVERLRWMLRSAGAVPKETRRKGRAVLYFKDFDAIVELLTRIGAFGAVLAARGRACAARDEESHPSPGQHRGREPAALRGSGRRAPPSSRISSERIRAAAADARAAGSRGASALVSRRIARGAGAALQSADREANRERAAGGAQPVGRLPPRCAGERESGQVNALMRIGINGFGRIGRNFTKGDGRTPSRNRNRGGQRFDRRAAMRAPFQIRQQLRHFTRAAWRGRTARLAIDRSANHGLRRTRPGPAPVARLRRRRRDRVDRSLHERREGARPHRQRRREESHHLGARDRRGHHDRPRRQRPELRSRQARRHLQRVVHDELPRDRREAGGRLARVGARAS